jgi:O-methyltransferase involved in polyketide biosynthesis
MDTTFRNLTPVEDSLFLTLYLRALDARSPFPLLGDARSADLAGQLDYDFSRQKALRNQVLDLALRTRRLDDLVRGFMARNRDAVVLDLGCGLDPRAMRCRPPDGVDWYDIDYPAVATIRESVLPGESHVVAADLGTSSWWEGIPTDRPTIAVADGLMAFMIGDAFKTLARTLATHFATGEFAFNAYTPLDLWAANFSSTFKALGARTAGDGIVDPHEVESWGASLILVEELLLVRDPDVARYPQPLRSFTRLCARSTRISRHGNRILRYAF